MKPDEIFARRIAAEIETELTSIERLVKELNLTSGASDTTALRARGSILHDFYTGVERVLVRFAEELDGGVPGGDQWHRRLLLNMTLEIRDVRPPILTQELANRLGAYLRFRHVFRNVYGFVLDSERMRPLEKELAVVSQEFLEQVRSFLAWIVGQ